MIQVVPEDKYEWVPCSQVALCIACEQAGREYFLPISVFDAISNSENGYLTLRDMDSFVRALLPVKKRADFKRKERPLLRELEPCKAVVCVVGHYLYLDNDKYYSFFDNENDEVVAMWIIDDKKVANNGGAANISNTTNCAK